MGSDEETEVSEHETDHGQELSCFQWCYTRARGSMLCWLPPYEQVCWCQFSLVKIKCSYLQLQLKTSFQSKLPINEMFTINRKLNIWYQILQVQTQQTNDENNDDQNRCVICLEGREKTEPFKRIRYCLFTEYYFITNTSFSCPNNDFISECKYKSRCS